MVESELERAFTTLAEAFTLTETEITEEIRVIEQQVGQLKERIIQLNGKQQTLAHDRQSITDMLSRYAQDDSLKPS